MKTQKIPPVKHPEPNGIDLNDPFKYVWDESKMEWHKTTSDEDVGKYMAQMKPLPIDPNQKINQYVKW